MKATTVSYDPKRDAVEFTYNVTRLRYYRDCGKWRRDWWYTLMTPLRAFRRGYWSLAKRLEGRDAY